MAINLVAAGFKVLFYVRRPERAAEEAKQDDRLRPDPICACASWTSACISSRLKALSRGPWPGRELAPPVVAHLMK